MPKLNFLVGIIPITPRLSKDKVAPMVKGGTDDRLAVRPLFVEVVAISSVEATFGNVKLVGTATIARVTHEPGDVAGINVAVGVGLEVRRDDVVTHRSGFDDDGARVDENHRRKGD